MEVVIEVAETSGDADRSIKGLLYARAGVPEFSLVRCCRGDELAQSDGLMTERGEREDDVVRYVVVEQESHDMSLAI